MAAIFQAQARYALLPHLGKCHPPALPSRTPQPPVPIVVGVSGGGDSVCLLHALMQVAHPWNLALHVAHLDHNLRPKSVNDAKFVAKLANKFNLLFHTEKLDRGQLDDAPGGVEAGARRARYDFLSRIARQVTPTTQTPIIAVAHHQDDQAETILMNFLRGSGLHGLAGMDWIATLQRFNKQLADDIPGSAERPIRLIRPLLGVSRAQIHAYLTNHNLTWVQDHTNLDTRRLRNQIRHDLLPMLRAINPNLTETLARSAHLLSGEAKRIARLDRQNLAALMLEQTGKERIVLDLEQFLNQDLATQRGVFHAALTTMSQDLREVGFDRIESLIWQLRQHDYTPNTHPLTGTIRWTVLAPTGERPHRLSLHQQSVLPIQPDHPFLDQEWRATVGRHTLACPGEAQINSGWTLACSHLPVEKLPAGWVSRDNRWRVYLDGERVGPLAIIAPQAGLRFAPLGLKGHHKQLGDFFTDRKIPLALREGWPLVVNLRINATGRKEIGQEIIWVCGQEIAHHTRITTATRQAVRLQWIQNDMSTRG